MSGWASTRGQPAPTALLFVKARCSRREDRAEVSRTCRQHVPGMELEAVLYPELMEAARGTWTGGGPSSDWVFLKFSMSRCWGEVVRAVHGARGERPPVGCCIL